MKKQIEGALTEASEMGYIEGLKTAIEVLQATLERMKDSFKRKWQEQSKGGNHVQ